MIIHWKAVEQYFTAVLFNNPLNPRVKPWVMQSFLPFDSMDRTLRCDCIFAGAIELSILSKHYQTEIAVVDTESGRIDRFGKMYDQLQVH